MSLIIATGSNLGDKQTYLKKAKAILKENFKLKSESRIYHSKAEDYLDQPNFFNQVLEFETPDLSPDEIMSKLFIIENSLGRIRKINKGPRTIDLDILFLGTDTYKSELVTLPHPKLFERSFVVEPLKELPYFSELNEHYAFPKKFENCATPI